MRLRFPAVPLFFAALVALALALPAAVATPTAAAADPLALLAVQQAELTGGDGAAYDCLGYSVALDGDTALVGAPYHEIGGNDFQGAAYIFTRSGAVWTQQAEVTAADGTAGDEFGYTIALDGDTALVAAPARMVGGNTYQGAAYIFTRSGTVWTQQAEVTAADGAADDAFGFSVALDGGTALVGAHCHNAFRGAAYVFTGSGSSWTQQAELAAADAAVNDHFGYAVALDGGTALVGARHHTVGGKASRGAAYVFTGSGSSWTQQAELTAADGAVSDYFGHAVALDGDTALVGAPNRNDYRGAAYAFTRTNSSWTLQAELAAADGAVSDCFGHAVALDGDTALVGARKHMVGGNGSQGAAYAFTRTNSSWAQQAELTAGDGAANDRFGHAVALDGESALVGACNHMVGGNAYQGAAYVFTSASPASAIASLAPTSAKRGASVTITGSGFGDAQGTSTVAFGDAACTEYASWGDTGIVCTVPAAAASGAQDVTVTTSAGASEAPGFTVLPYDAPTVTIRGAGSSWRKSAVALTATATVDPALGLSALEYRSGGATTWTQVPGSGTSRTLSISTEGATKVVVRARDSVGQAATDVVTVRIDRTAPTLRLAGRSLKLWISDGHRMRLKLLWRDAAGSRVRLQARLTQYGTQKQQLCRLTLAHRSRWQTLVLPFRPKAPGRYALHLVLTDQGGHQRRASALVVARR